MKKSIGIETKKPKEKCDDKYCPFHGNISLRGRTLKGTIIKSKIAKSVVFEQQRTRRVPKYERYEKRRTRIRVHNPPCINAEEGDIVVISECRPISKTKRFVIIENLGKEKHFAQKKEAKEEGKAKKTDKELKNIEKKKEETEQKEVSETEQIKENQEEKSDRAEK